MSIPERHEFVRNHESVPWATDVCRFRFANDERVCGQSRDAEVHAGEAQECRCPFPGLGSEYKCDDAQGTPFPSHCHCVCHKGPGGLVNDSSSFIEGQESAAEPWRIERARQQSSSAAAPTQPPAPYSADEICTDCHEVGVDVGKVAVKLCAKHLNLVRPRE